MTDRRDPLLASQYPDVAVPCGRRSQVLLGRAFVLLMLCASVNSAAGLQILEEDDDVAAPVVGERQFMITEQQFDQMVFGGQQQVVQRAVAVPRAQVVRRVNRVQVIEVVEAAEVVQNLVVQSSIADFRKRMESIAVAEIEAVDRRVSLTEAQKKKLKLAARGDVAQIVSRAAELRPKLTSKPINQQQYVALMKELQPLRMSQQFGILGENSLFRKTLRGTLTAEQRVRFQTLVRERQRTIVSTALQNLERTTNGLRLLVEKRDKVIEVLLERGRIPQSNGPYDQYIVLLEASLLRDELRPLLSETEWEKFELHMVSAKRLVPTLESYGLWTERRSNVDDDEVADAAKE